MEKFLKRKETILTLWKHDKNFLETLSSEELFILIFTFINDTDIRELIIKDSDFIINRCGFDYDMYNYFTLLALKLGKVNVEKCDDILNRTVKKIFSSKTLILLMKKYKEIKTNGIIPKEELFNKILNDLEKRDTEESSTILFDLAIFPDFAIFLKTNHRVISTLIEAYQIYAPEVMSSKIFNGSTIIGKLLKENNEQIIANYLKEILKDKHISTRDIKMIGGGSTSLVYKIRDLVIKFGETRHNRKIYINHRILASLYRKLERNELNEELFYIEVMKYAITGDVTPEERDELKKDLYEQGLIWDDDKLENCGVLVDGDENTSPTDIDYSEVAGIINNEYRREQFMKRKRKVVVIDNDDIRFNPMISSR